MGFHTSTEFGLLLSLMFLLLLTVVVISIRVITEKTTLIMLLVMLVKLAMMMKMSMIEFDHNFMIKLNYKATIFNNHERLSLMNRIHK